MSTTTFKCPPPKKAVQHTRCWIALTAIMGTLEVYNIGGTEEIDKLVSDIKRLSKMCSSELEARKKISIAATRNIKKHCDVMADFAKNYIHINPSKGNFSISTEAVLTLVYASTLFMEDVRNTCPEYYNGTHWINLFQHVRKLSDSIEEMENDKILEEGTDLYVRANPT